MVFLFPPFSCAEIDECLLYQGLGDGGYALSICFILLDSNPLLSVFFDNFFYSLYRVMRDLNLDSFLLRAFRGTDQKHHLLFERVLHLLVR